MMGDTRRRLTGQREKRRNPIILLITAGAAIAGPIEDCPILQTTDIKTPCHIRIDNRRQQEPVPPFVYAFNLPKGNSFGSCPLIQTLDSSALCYSHPKTKDDSAFYLTVPLPPKADEIDESPAGLAKLKAAKEENRMKEAPADPPQSPDLTQAIFNPTPTFQSDDEKFPRPATASHLAYRSPSSFVNVISTEGLYAPPYIPPPPPTFGNFGFLEPSKLPQTVYGVPF